MNLTTWIWISTLMVLSLIVIARFMMNGTAEVFEIMYGKFM